MDDLKSTAAAVYNAAADHFDDPALGFWDRFGEGTIERLDLRAGAAVLDVCAGSGASALPAARRVGPTGRVVAVDVAENLLALAAQKARQQGLTNVELRHEDLEALGYPPESFDAVVIVFGIFFLPDWHAAASYLWRLVKPGGQLAVTTWGKGAFEPGSSVFWSEAANLRPELCRAYNPWDRLTEPTALGELFTGAGARDPHVEVVAAVQPLRSPADFWTIVLGTGLRATHDAMSEEHRQLLSERVVAELARRSVTEVQTNVIYGVAKKDQTS